MLRANQTTFIKPFAMTVLKKKIQISFWVFIVLAIFLVIFSVQNAGSIEVRILIWPVHVSLSILLIGTFLTGLITGALYAYNKFLPKSPKIEEEDQDALNEKFNSTKKPADSRAQDISPKDF